MKKMLCLLLAGFLLAGCTAAPAQTTPPPESVSAEDFESRWADSGFIRIQLGDSMPAVTLPDGTPENAVTFANDIIYYESGRDETYGEGEAHEAHTAEEAAKHTVVHINAPGTYVLTGNLSAGQIAVDLGDDAEDDPNAVVTLILDGLNIVNTVAPAVIFYNVYECGDKDNPSATVDTSAAGANVILADGSINNIVGSHVAKIYKSETVIDGNTDDAKKLHKYDGAFYSKMSMNVGGEGCLNITADNEGLDSELHLTINGGNINIASGNDGINTNANGVSVTTINGGSLTIHVTGTTGEGDGIDSNGWLVINGGQVRASACGTSGDAGIDSDMGIQLGGGTVCATGNMLDRIEDGGQTHAVFTFANRQEPGIYTLKNAQGDVVAEYAAPNAFQYLIFSAPALTEGIYTLWSGDVQYQGAAGSGMGFGGNMVGGQVERPDWPGQDGDVEIPPQPTQPLVTQGVQEPPSGQMPEDMPVPEMPEGGAAQMPNPNMSGNSEQMPIPELPEGVEPGGRQDGQGEAVVIPSVALFTEFAITQGANYFMNVGPVES